MRRDQLLRMLRRHLCGLSFQRFGPSGIFIYWQERRVAHLSPLIDGGWEICFVRHGHDLTPCDCAAIARLIGRVVPFDVVYSVLQ